MGKASIQSHKGSGLYSIQVQKDDRRIELEKIRLQERIDQITSSLVDITDEDQLNFAKLRRTNLQQRLNKLNEIDPTEIMDAWCADYTEDLSGEVGTIEIAKNAENGLIVKPGYTGSAVWDNSIDGQMQPIIGNTPAAAAFNFISLPGSQYHYPMYRIGTITALDTGNDTCSLTLDSTISKFKDKESAFYNLNQQDILNNVPIEYMNCNSAAFTTGDRVLIQFTGYSWDTPVVIGFESNPEKCVTGACFIVGEIVSVSGGYDETTQTLNIKDLNNDITPILTRPSDWIEWAVGDQVIAISTDNCDCSDQCGEDAEEHFQTNRILELTNALRVDEGLNPLVMNRLLSEAAERHVDDMIANCFQDHEGTDGTHSLDRITDTGYLNFYDEAWTGENLSHSIGADETFAGWVASPIHYANLIKPEYREMGLSMKITSCESIAYDGGTVDLTGYSYYAVCQTFGAKIPSQWMVVPLEILSEDIL